MPSVTDPLISIIIVNYNGGAYLLNSVASALAAAMSVEIWVVDNGSQDGSVAALRLAHGNEPLLHLIENGLNLGFARANNIALRQARGDYVLLLNPDCVLANNTLTQMLLALDAHPQAGMAGCLICNPDGSEQAGCRRAIPTPWTGLLRALPVQRWQRLASILGQVELRHYPLPTIPMYVEAISGAFMLIRRIALMQVGLLDEGYFLHCEDLDWCESFRQAGWQILFVPSVAIIHHKGACSATRPLFVLWHKHRGMARFYRKFLSKRYSWPLNGLVLIGIWLRFLLLIPVERLRQSALLPPSPPPLIAPEALPIFEALIGHLVLVTGGTGFIGRRLVDELLRQGARVRILSRSRLEISEHWPAERMEWICADLTQPDSLTQVGNNCTYLFHLASYAHRLDDNINDTARHYQVTEQGTAALLRVAQSVGIRSFVFVSSVKAMGEGNENCLDETTPAIPENAYGQAKLTAEYAVLAANQQDGMHTCVLRLPMVYGPGNKGNLPRMIDAIRAGRFPPLPEVGNRRSMVHVDDVVQALLRAATTPHAAGQVYLVTDGQVYSTAGLYKLIATHLDQPPPRWCVPLWLLHLAAGLGDGLTSMGLPAPLRRETLRKLLGSAWYSNNKIRRELGFTPRYNLRHALPKQIHQPLQENPPIQSTPPRTSTT